MTRAVIFDLDGLIVDSEPLHQESFNRLLARHGIAYRIGEEEYGKVFVGVPVRENFEWLIENRGLQISVEQAIVEREAAFLELISNPRNIVVMPGARALIQALTARGIPIALATGASRAEAETMLRGIGITNHFRAVVTGSDAARGKPAPDIYLRALERLELRGEECLALEDSASGIAAAKAAGLRVIAVPNRFTRHQDLSRADKRVESLEHVEIED